MQRYLVAAITAGAGLLASTTAAEAQVFVKAPFVRVQVGGPGVHVRAPFVNIFVPNNNPPPYYMPPAVVVAPQPFVPQPFVPPQPRLAEVPQLQPVQPPVQPDPQQPPAKIGDAPQAQPGQLLTLEQFAKSFQPKAGSYEVTLLNPATGKGVPVQFTLPSGAPKRVLLRPNEIEFDYGIRRFVRIGFDEDGAIVTSR